MNFSIYHLVRLLRAAKKEKIKTQCNRNITMQRCVMPTEVLGTGNLNADLLGCDTV
jgi:hypothetical protein